MLILDYHNNVLTLSDDQLEYFALTLSPAQAGELAIGIELAFGLDRVRIHNDSDLLISLGDALRVIT